MGGGRVFVFGWGFFFFFLESFLVGVFLVFGGCVWFWCFCFFLFWSPRSRRVARGILLPFFSPPLFENFFRLKRRSSCSGTGTHHPSPLLSPRPLTLFFQVCHFAPSATQSDRNTCLIRHSTPLFPPQHFYKDPSYVRVMPHALYEKHSHSHLLPSMGAPDSFFSLPCLLSRDPSWWCLPCLLIRALNSIQSAFLRFSFPLIRLRSSDGFLPSLPPL